MPRAYDPGQTATDPRLPHDDDFDEQIQARNIAGVVTSMGSANDGTPTISSTRPSGAAKQSCSTDGVAIPSNWSKRDAHSHVRFLDFTGNEIALNRGQSWIEVLSFRDSVLY